MEKADFIARMAKRIDAKTDVIEQIVDATLAEAVGPVIFALPGERRRFLDDTNNCHNNCAAEIARQQPARGL